MYDHDASDGASGAEEDGVKRDFSPANDPDIWPHDNIGFPDRFAKGRRFLCFSCYFLQKFVIEQPAFQLLFSLRLRLRTGLYNAQMTLVQYPAPLLYSEAGSSRIDRAGHILH
jgi:hypothetical protein